AVYESWAVGGVVGQAPATNTYVMNLYDATGEQIFGAQQIGVSDEKLAVTGGISDVVIGGDVPTYVKANGEAFARALQVFAGRRRRSARRRARRSSRTEASSPTR